MTFNLRAFLRFVPGLLLLAVTACGRPEVPAGARDPGAISVEGVLGKPLLLATGASTVYARIRIGTLTRPAQARGPVNIALVMDTSGSMEGEAIKESKRAALQMIEMLHDGDRLALVVFHTKAETLLPSTELTPEVRADVNRRVAAIEAQGTTAMAEGLGQGLAEVRSFLDAKGINRVILLGDGIPNRPTSIEAVARSAGGSGVAITTLGLGLDYDETLMGKIADLSGGRFKYVETADKVAGFLREEMERLDMVYARQATALLTPGPGVVIESVVGSVDSSYSGNGGPQQITLGDIARGDKRDILVRLTVTPRKAGVPIELLDTVISFDDALESAGRLERHVYLGAHTTTDEAQVAKAINTDVELSAALAEASATTIRALELAKNGAYVRARAMLSKGSEAALAQAKRTPNPALSKHAEDMVAVAKDMPEVDRPAPPAPSPSYEFQDDASAAPAAAAAPESEAILPEVARKRKEAHSTSFEALH